MAMAPRHCSYSAQSAVRNRFGLYTILSRPTLYGVWLTEGGSEGGGAYIVKWSCNSIAIG